MKLLQTGNAMEIAKRLRIRQIGAAAVVVAVLMVLAACENTELGLDTESDEAALEVDKKALEDQDQIRSELEDFVPSGDGTQADLTTMESGEMPIGGPSESDETLDSESDPATANSNVRRSAPVNSNGVAYFNDFSDPSDRFRVDNFVHYRDDFLEKFRTGSSDHGSTGGVNCTVPEETRPQTRENPQDHIYMCLPMGQADLGHMMAYAMDTTGYGFVGGLPDQVFEDVSEVSVDVNTTSAGNRNFVEIKVIPADQTFVNAMPCVPQFPCNGFDYDDLGAVGASTSHQGGSGLKIATPTKPDGYKFGRETFTDQNGINYRMCPDNGDYCSSVGVQSGNTDIRSRFKHILRDNGDNTISFGIENGETTEWATVPGSFPSGSVRVAVVFHNYTGTKSGQGPGFDNNLSPSTGGFTWHWDELTVHAEGSTPSEDFYTDNLADHIVTPDDCIAFSQGPRGQNHHRYVLPRFECANVT